MDPAIWVVAASAALSGFFALSSFSLRSFSRARLEEVFAGRFGTAGRRRLERLDAHLEPLRLTLALCRSLANLVLVVGMMRLLRVDPRNWAGIATAVVWSGSIIAIVGVAIPYAWAACAAERILALTTPVLLALWVLLLPITAVMRAFDLPIRRLSGTSDGEDETAESAKQEILQAASEGQAEGAVDAEEVEMIESVMEFGQTDAAAIMTPRTDIFALPDDTPWAEAARRIHQAGHTRVPAYNDSLDNITGMIYVKDLLRYVGRDCPESLAEIIRKPFFVPETKPLDDLLREFKARKVHVAIVVDEYGGTAGLVSIEDVLEEIVGEISDEYDRPEEQPFRRINETTAEVDGRMRIDELNDLLGLELPEDEDYDTVAGFAIAELGYIPAAGEAFAASDAEFTVIEADERKITKLRARKLPADEDRL